MSRYEDRLWRELCEQSEPMRRLGEQLRELDAAALPGVGDRVRNGDREGAIVMLTENGEFAYLLYEGGHRGYAPLAELVLVERGQ